MRRCRRFCRTGARGRHLLRCDRAAVDPSDRSTGDSGSGRRACMQHAASAVSLHVFLRARFSRGPSTTCLPLAAACWSVRAAPPCCHVRPFPCRLWSWRLEMETERRRPHPQQRRAYVSSSSRARAPASPHHAARTRPHVRGQPYVEAAYRRRQSSLLRRRQRPIALPSTFRLVVRVCT
jgi:hypothetical protein